MKLLKNLFDIEKVYLKKYEQFAIEVINKEEEYSQLSDEQLQAKTDEFRSLLVEGSTIDDIAVDAFATVREAATRVLKMTPFKVQIMGARALVDANIAEMKTGEGKTLTSTMAVYLLALKGDGVHVVTVNEYLASRDAEEMGVLYNFLNMTVGLSLHAQNPTQKRAEYAKDITYVTNSELGFDYLRDNMALHKSERSLRKLANVIIDEVDSILIDEARTPLIISGQEVETLEVYQQVDAAVKKFIEDEDFVVNLKDKVVNIQEPGINKLERSLIRGNLFDLENSQWLHAVNQALKANFAMFKDVDYVVKEGKIIIVDPFTGRLMDGRQYSEGLHQAIEAKEKVTTNKVTKTLATITYQNFFRLYDHLSGMTGTAKTEEEEFQKTYGIDVVEIPTNAPMIRIDNDDVVFQTEAAKFEYMIAYIKERHQHGQPILIGTVAIETSERIANELRKSGLKPNVLNAKQHESEAEIVSKAGHVGALTIATNMAGRGTDIKISDEVKMLSGFDSEVTGNYVDPTGLLIVGTERHESRRIDNQLRGRSGRQGDNGESTFFVSFEDELMKRFVNKNAMKIISMADFGNEAISNKNLTKSIEQAQRQVESVNYEIRKSILKYDDVLREQRETVYEQRDYILDNNNILPEIRGIIEEYIKNTVDYYQTMDELDQIESVVRSTFTNKVATLSLDLEGDLVEQINELAEAEYTAKLKIMGEDDFNLFAKTVVLRVLDGAWVDHIDLMSKLRHSIGLRGYGQIDPLHEYQREGRLMFEEMMNSVEKEIVRIILKGRIQSHAERETAMNRLEAEHNRSVGEKQKTFVKAEKKVSRNASCPCGSGKKYKDCCGK